VPQLCVLLPLLCLLSLQKLLQASGRRCRRLLCLLLRRAQRLQQHLNEGILRLLLRVLLRLLRLLRRSGRKQLLQQVLRRRSSR